MPKMLRLAIDFKCTYQAHTPDASIRRNNDSLRINPFGCRDTSLLMLLCYFTTPANDPAKCKHCAGHFLCYICTKPTSHVNTSDRKSMSNQINRLRPKQTIERAKFKLMCCVGGIARVTQTGTFYCPHLPANDPVKEKSITAQQKVPCLMG